MLRVLSCIAQEHDLRLVALSACICALGCFTTVTLMARSMAASGTIAIRWICFAAAVFGCTVWSLHFVAMLAFMPHLDIAYEAGLTGLSIVIAVVGGLIGLSLHRFSTIGPAASVLGGVVLGAGVVGMHYTGVAAMRLPGQISLDPTFVLASVAIGLGFGALALARARTLVRLGRRLEIVAWLAVTICGLHFTGMTAVTITPGPEGRLSGSLIGSDRVALTVGLVSLAILLASLTGTLMKQLLSERALQELSRMRLLSDLAHEVLLIHRDDKVLEVNSAGSRLFGQPAEAIIGRPVLDLFTPDSAPALIRRTRCSPAERRPEEVEARTALGTHVPVELSCQQIEFQGKPATAIALRDLSDRRRDEARIRHLALHDSLTDLPNRHLLEERLTRSLDASAQDGTRVAVLYLDLDRFKPVNDLLGHAAGDALLVQVVRRLGARVRPADTLARIGGDEFVMVLANADDTRRVSTLATNVLDDLCRPFVIDDHRVEVGASIGIAFFPEDGHTPEALLRNADTAMYRVKEEGRGAVRFFEPAMDAELQARRQLEQELAQATDRAELVLFYQPILNGRTGEVETFEALVRWRHPQRGLVLPGEFIAVAEQSDLIGRIGEWVINEACATAARWPKPWRVSVNVSPSQFRQSDIPQIVAAALARHNLPPNRLVLEITETIFIDNATKAVEILSQLRAQGVRLALDDFGTGYSSLSYLQLFTFDKFKIDRSFVQKLALGGNALTIVKAIINLGHNLGIAVTAEGVETREQLAVLRLLGCDQLQGFLFGHPAPIASVDGIEAVPPMADFEPRENLPTLAWRQEARPPREPAVSVLEA